MAQVMRTSRCNISSNRQSRDYLWCFECDYAYIGIHHFIAESAEVLAPSAPERIGVVLSVLKHDTLVRGARTSRR